MESLSLGGGTRVFSIVCQFARKAGRCNGVGVDDRCATTSNKSPDTAVGIKDGELERGTGLRVEIGNVSLLLAHLPTEGSGKFHWWTCVNVDLAVFGQHGWDTKSSRAASNGPFYTTLKLGRLIKLRSQVEEVDLSRGSVFVGNDDERINLQIASTSLDN